MHHNAQHSSEQTPPRDGNDAHIVADLGTRRAFLAQMAMAGVGLATTPAWMEALSASVNDPPKGGWSEAWLDGLKGKHKQFFDAYNPNDGFPLLFAANFLNQYNQAYKIPDSELTAVVGLRHFAAPMGFN